MLLILLSFSSGLGWAAQRTLIPKVWNGELMEADEGGIYVQSVLADLGARSRNGSFNFVLQGRRRQLQYVFQTNASGLKESPQTVWKIKEDDYDLIAITLVDEQGLKWDWKGPYRHGFKVQGKSLSYFGVWYLVQIAQGHQLKILAKPGTNVFKDEQSQGAFQSIIEASTGRELKTLTEKAAVGKQELRHVIRSTQTIGMFYKLNLFKQNAYAEGMSQIIQANDPDIRSCYTDYIERVPDSQGQVAYTFVYSSVTKSIKSLKVKQTDFRDGRFLECLNLKLMGLDFNIGSSLIGELTFSFQLGQG